MEEFRSHAHGAIGKEAANVIQILPPLPTEPQNIPPNDRTPDNLKLKPETSRCPKIPDIMGWPQKPSTLTKRPRRAARLFVDTILALVPVLFIALSLMAVYVSGSELSATGEKVRAATKLGPTLFPMVFAAIIGRSLKALAAYSAERGAKLGKLEQMIGSLTMFGAVELQISLRTFDVLGVGLLTLWALSPMGGQASLRLLDIGLQSSQTNQTLKYLDPNSQSFLGEGADTVSELGFLADTLYLAALLTPPTAQAEAMDTWGNVKIPTIEKLEQVGKSDTDGWHDVSAKNSSFSSLVGIPVAGVSDTSLSTFTVESQYMSTSCSTLSSFGEAQTHGQGFSIGLSEGSSSKVMPFANETSYPVVEPAHINFTSGSTAFTEVFSADCILTRSSVESNITCDGKSCRVTQIRRSNFDRRPTGYTPLSFGFTGANLASSWPSAAGHQHPGTSGITEYFLSDPTLSNLPGISQTVAVDLVGMSAATFSERFAFLLNTYYQCSIAPWYRTGNLLYDQSSLDGILDDVGGTFNATTALTTSTLKVYIYSKTWVLTLLLTSGILLSFGLCGAILRYKTRGPQILGYVSTMTRDNPYFNLPPGGCTLDGLDRARLLKDADVKIQDVAPQKDVGHISMGYAGPYELRTLASGRLYAGIANG